MTNETLKAPHTPGPWDIDKTAVLGMGPWVIGRDGYVVGTTRLEADAKLMRAAPEMLDILKIVEMHLEHYPENNEIKLRVSEVIRKAQY